jgi:hypothetical protein
MSEKTTKPIAMRMSLWDREDGLVALGCVGPDDLNTRVWKIGDKLTFEVVGLERKSWEGIEVR